MPESDLLHVVAVPYLPLNERAQIGTWQLIPFGEFAASDARGDRALRQARQLFEYYERPDSMAEMGAVARRGRRTVGERIQPSGIEPLHLALVLAVLDSNPTSGVNRGHSMMTSDNAVVWRHRIDSVGHVAADYGSVVRNINFGMRLGEPSARVRAPIELASRIIRRGIDARYASAMFEVLNAKIDEARGLAGACRWLDVAWRNTPSMDRNLRILALYSGFEALFPGESRVPIARHLSRLFDPPGARRQLRRWKRRPDQARIDSEELTALGWWFVRFGGLRNQIAHGHPIPAASWRHGRELHFWLAERRLRETINLVVARRAGVKELRLEYGDRVMAWAYRDAGYPMV